MPKRPPGSEHAQELGRPRDVPEHDRAQRSALLGLMALRRGETENRRTDKRSEAVREAIDQFSAHLANWPDDLRIRWFLNIAYKELGEYPDRVPVRYRIILDRFRTTVKVPPFSEVAEQAGLCMPGPSPAGGSVFDDLDGDGSADLFVTSLDTRRGASLFVNGRDGTFLDRSSRAGIDGQIYALNVTRADIENDGDIDLLLLRGGWDRPLRLSLLTNRGDGTFNDVTVASGLGDPIASGSAAWADFDDDGWVDVFVCSEGGRAPDSDRKPKVEPLERVPALSQPWRRDF